MGSFFSAYIRQFNTLLIYYKLLATLTCICVIKNVVMMKASSTNYFAKWYMCVTRVQ